MIIHESNPKLLKKFSEWMTHPEFIKKMSMNEKCIDFEEFHKLAKVYYKEENHHLLGVWDEFSDEYAGFGMVKMNGDSADVHHGFDQKYRGAYAMAGCKNMLDYCVKILKIREFNCKVELAREKELRHVSRFGFKRLREEDGFAVYQMKVVTDE